MFTTMSTMTIGLNYGAPAGAMKGAPVPLFSARLAIDTAMRDNGIDCYTVIACKGYWQGAEEDSLRVEVMHNDGHKGVVNAARAIKADLMQEAILVTKQEVQGDLV